jgi:hypothetical protein
MMPVVAVGNALCVFSKERWTRSLRPWLRQFPQACADVPDMVWCELGHLAESAIASLRVERLE